MKMESYITIFTFVFFLGQSGWAESQIHKAESTHWGNCNIVAKDKGSRHAIAGDVVDMDGIPVEGAFVEVFADETPKGKDWQYPTKRVATCKTDSKGRFEFVAVPPGMYELRCSLENFQTYSLMSILIVPVIQRVTAKPIVMTMIPAT